jgi:hypothetical protein
MNASKSWGLVVVGYAVLALAMVAFMTINGVSDTAVGTLATAGLISLGLAIPAGGMLGLATRTRREGILGRGLLLQTLSLLSLLIGLVTVFFAASLPVYLMAASLIVLSGVSGLTAASYFSRNGGTRYLIVGAALIAIGAAVIPASNIALKYLYLISDTDNSIYQDVGATLAACGAVLAAYSFFILSTSKGRKQEEVYR